MASLKPLKRDYSALLQSYRLFLQEERPDIDFEKLCHSCHITPDSGSVDSRQMALFTSRLLNRSGNPQILRAAGRAAGRRSGLGLMQQLGLGLGGPTRLLEKLIREQAALSGQQWDIRSPGRNLLDITIPGDPSHHWSCQYHSGFLESLALLFNQRSPGLAHPRCSRRGDRHCHYQLTWDDSPAESWRRRRNRTAMLTTVSLLAVPWLPPVAAATLPPLGLAAMLAMTAFGGTLERNELRRHLQHQQATTEEVVDQANASLINLQLTREIGQAISSRSDSDDLLRAVSDILAHQLDFDRGMILLADSQRKALHYRCGFGLNAAELKRLESPLALSGRHDRTPLAPLLINKRGLLINDVRQFQDVRVHNLCRWFAGLGSRAFACCPIISDQQVIGMLALDLRTPKRLLVESDLQLLEGIAPLIGIGLQNSRLLDERSAQFQSVIQVLAASIDARDFLTAGHSVQVTEYAVGICNQLGLGSDYTDMVRIAAMLHDYGKLAVPDFILKKDGELNAEEKALIRTHPDKSREILERIPFEGIYRQIPEVVGAHHEKLDGSGYPNGLKGDEIPLGARIIAVADFFEAITSKRHYRDPMPYHEALQLLAEESLVHFDKQVVDALFCHISENKICMVDNSGDEEKKLDRRKVRVPCRTQVSCQVANRTISGTSTNLSNGGIFIASDTGLDEGNLIDVIFALPDSPDQLLKLQGRVAWNNPLGRQAQGLPEGFGLEFVNLPEETSGALNGYISRFVARKEAGLASGEILTVH
ncbi:HD domain-containing phosphohydrolase [Geothermobacter hydrogeniphilus]|uniref:HD-GYP domain-containing protein n=1 Tax=Geothermobacter hydrogeniphilus TaxID=1969733 RepID=A0A1X0Y5M5_9BACT|nr:HD domain-containing phosphohydrolase [Geothermobacter hydrogeniphilus]ORJ60510.1 hypothetical protein B5V00_08075 [Geothermobacter hydrogeniphilus]